jgi:hypothetical protein
MTTLPCLDEPLSLKLEEIHRLSRETHATVQRMELTHNGNAETLKKIEANTAVVAQFFEQLETVTKLAAGKNQVPMIVFIALLVVGGAYAIAVTLKDSNMGVKIPWLGIEITSKEGSKAER